MVKLNKSKDKNRKSQTSNNNYYSNDLPGSKLNDSKSKSNWFVLSALGFKIIFLFINALISTIISSIFPTNLEFKKRYRSASYHDSNSEILNDKSDPYLILGIQKGTDLNEIKKLYYKLALKFHPDRLVGKSDVEKAEAEEKMKSINWAYEKIQKDLNEEKNGPQNKNVDEDEIKDCDISKNGKHNKSRKRQPFKSTKNKNVNKKEAYESDQDNEDPKRSNKDSDDPNTYFKDEKEYESAFKEFQQKHKVETRLFKQQQALRQQQQQTTFSSWIPFSLLPNDLSPAPKAPFFQDSSNGGHSSSQYPSTIRIPKNTTTTTTSTTTSTTTNKNKNMHSNKHVLKANHSTAATGNPPSVDSTSSPAAPPPNTFDLCSHDIAIAIRHNLLLVFLEITGSPPDHQYTVFEKIDVDKNTGLHYCIYYNNISIAERMISCAGGEWYKLVLARNSGGLTAFGLSQSLASDSEYTPPPHTQNDRLSTSCLSSTFSSTLTREEFLEKLKLLEQSAESYQNELTTMNSRKIDWLNIIPFLLVFSSVFLGSVAVKWLTAGRPNLTTLEAIFLGCLVAVTPKELLKISTTIELGLILLFSYRALLYFLVTYSIGWVLFSGMGCLGLLFILYYCRALTSVICAVLIVHVIFNQFVEMTAFTHYLLKQFILESSKFFELKSNNQSPWIRIKKLSDKLTLNVDSLVLKKICSVTGVWYAIIFYQFLFSNNNSSTSRVSH